MNIFCSTASFKISDFSCLLWDLVPLDVGLQIFHKWYIKVGIGPIIENKQVYTEMSEAVSQWSGHSKKQEYELIRSILMLYFHANSAVTMPCLMSWPRKPITVCYNIEFH